MARLPKQFSAVELTTLPVVLYTVDANVQAQIAACSVANKTGTARYVTVTLTPSGGTARNMVYQVVIPAASQIGLFAVVGQCLDPGDSISALAEANGAIDLVMGGFEAT